MSTFCDLIYYKRLVSVLYKFPRHTTFILSGDHAIFRVCRRTLSASDDQEDQWGCTWIERVNLPQIHMSGSLSVRLYVRSPAHLSICPPAICLSYMSVNTGAISRKIVYLFLFYLLHLSIRTLTFLHFT